MKMHTRSVDEDLCPRCASSVLEYYAVVELTAPPYRIERNFGQSCGNPTCHWQEIK